MSIESEKRKDAERLIASNPIAHSNYFIEEILEAGLVLQGTEVKSLRIQTPNIRDAFVDVRNKNGRFEAFLLNMHIGPYSHGNIWNHEERRARKLLLHYHQLEHMYVSITQRGISIIPIRMYFSKGRAKVELGFGKGKKKFDKRETLKKKSADREMDIARKYDR